MRCSPGWSAACSTEPLRLCSGQSDQVCTEAGRRQQVSLEQVGEEAFVIVL